MSSAMTNLSPNGATVDEIYTHRSLKDAAARVKATPALRDIARMEDEGGRRVPVFVLGRGDGTVAPTVEREATKANAREKGAAALVLGIFFALLAVVLIALAFSGCSGPQLQSFEVAAKADANTFGTLLIGVGTAALDNPAVMSEAASITNAGLVAAGVTQAHADEVTAAINAKDAGALVAAGKKIKTWAAPVTGAPTAAAPQDPPEEFFSLHCPRCHRCLDARMGEPSYNPGIKLWRRPGDPGMDPDGTFDGCLRCLEAACGWTPR